MRDLSGGKIARVEPLVSDRIYYLIVSRPQDYFMSSTGSHNRQCGSPTTGTNHADSFHIRHCPCPLLAPDLLFACLNAFPEFPNTEPNSTCLLLFFYSLCSSRAEDNVKVSSLVNSNLLQHPKLIHRQHSKVADSNHPQPRLRKNLQS